jgi:PIN domain nuclease of toxin-antitoxin system
MLIDTCIAYDWLVGSIDRAKLDVILLENKATVSVVVIWEMLIKHNIGKLPLPTLELADTFTENGFNLLNITPAHAQAVGSLPNHHKDKDPFDRMLIAQATVERINVITYDTIFSDYLPESVIV